MTDVWNANKKYVQLLKNLDFKIAVTAILG